MMTFIIINFILVPLLLIKIGEWLSKECNFSFFYFFVHIYLDQFLINRAKRKQFQLNPVSSNSFD